MLHLLYPRFFTSQFCNHFWCPRLARLLLRSSMCLTLI